MGVSSLCFVVVSCFNYVYGYFNVYVCIVVCVDFDLVMYLGDYFYEYGVGQYGSVCMFELVYEIVMLDDYCQCYVQYKCDVDVQVMYCQYLLIVIWDDYEMVNNSWKVGVENYQFVIEGDWNVCVVVVMQVYYEWMFVCLVDVNKLCDNYCSFVYGDLVELLMLEECINVCFE